MKLTEQEELRVKELKQIGFELIDTGIRNPHSATRVSACYWRYMRGNRVSALHPHPEAAWRDCIREWEANLATAQSQPAKRYPANKELGEQVLEAILVKHGFTIKEHSWHKGGAVFGGHTNRSATLKDAVAYWSQHNPNDFLAAVLAASDESKLDEMMRRQVVLTDIMIESGVTIDIDKAKDTYLSLSSDPLPIDDMKRTLELAGYSFHFTGRVGWYCTQLGQRKDTGALETAVKAAWKHALDNGIDEVSLVSVVRGCNMTDSDVQTILFNMFPKRELLTEEEAEKRLRDGGYGDVVQILKAMDPPEWEGVGQPPIGTTLWVIPCNTLWGFPIVDTYLCKVLAYHGDYVWLETLSDIGEPVNQFVTTRVDKVEVKVWKGNKNA